MFNCEISCVLFSGFTGGKKKEVKKETGLGLSHKKADNFGEWYSEVAFFKLLSIMFSDYV